MKKECVIALSMLVASTTYAGDKIYDEVYGGKAVGRIEKGFIYDRAYGGKKIGITTGLKKSRRNRIV